MALSKPSDAPAGGGIAQFEKAVCVFTFRERGEATTDYGLKPYVAVDIDVVEGNVGQTSTPTKLGVEPQKLSAKPGDRLENVRIFQGWIRGSFNGQQPGGLVGGVPVVRFEDTKQGKNQPVWHLEDLTPEQEQKAETYLANRPKPVVSQPSAAPAPSQDEPEF